MIDKNLLLKSEPLISGKRHRLKNFSSFSGDPHHRVLPGDCVAHGLLPPPVGPVAGSRPAVRGLVDDGHEDRVQHDWMVMIG